MRQNEWPVKKLDAAMQLGFQREQQHYIWQLGWQGFVFMGCQHRDMEFWKEKKCSALM